MDLLIKNARIIDYCQDFTGDIYIKNGNIEKVGKNLKENCSKLDAEGKIVMPSFVDLHVHFRDPGFTHKEDIESGSQAAVKGGFTMVNLMANTNPVCSSMEVVDYVLNKASKIGLVDVHQTVSITKDFNGNDISHIDGLSSNVKILSEDGRDVQNSGVMLKAMVKAKKSGKIIMCHSEDSTLSKIDMRLSENIMTLRNVALAEYTGCHTHIAHVSTKESMEYIIEGKNRGAFLTCEVTPHHIALWDSDYKVNPPIREKEDVDYLIYAIENGFVDTISTDHAPHTSQDKKNGSPGMTGLETAFPICFTSLVKGGYIDINKLSKLMSKNPSDILKIKKGQITPGYDGDLILVDTDEEYEIDSSNFRSKGKNTPFNGKKVFGRVLKTIKAGNIVYRYQS